MSTFFPSFYILLHFFPSLSFCLLFSSFFNFFLFFCYKAASSSENTIYPQRILASILTPEPDGLLEETNRVIMFALWRPIKLIHKLTTWLKNCTTNCFPIWPHQVSEIMPGKIILYGLVGYYCGETERISFHNNSLVCCFL